MIITLYHFIELLSTYTLPNNLRALNNACFFKVLLAALIEPVLFKVCVAASIAVTHLFPVLVFSVFPVLVLFLPPYVFLVLFLLVYLPRFVVIIYRLNIKFIKPNI